MSLNHTALALLVSALVAVLPLSLLAWITSGSWSPIRVRLGDLALLFPMVIAVKLGLGRTSALVVSFLTYWGIAFAALAWYIKTTGLQFKPKRGRK